MSPHRHDAPAPRLRPGLVLLRRSRTTWQIGIDTAHAVLVRGADDATVRGLHALEPHRAPDPDARLDASVLARLAEQGLLTSPPPAAASDRLTSRHARRLQQLRGDSATAELVGAPDPVPRRRDARVAVAGSGPVAALVATGLAHAGIGTVAVLGPRRPVVPTDLTPAGPRLAEVGRPWVDAVSAAVRALGAATTLVEAPVDLAVLTQAADADAPWCDPEHADLWLRWVRRTWPRPPRAGPATSARSSSRAAPGLPALPGAGPHRRRPVLAGAGGRAAPPPPAARYRSPCRPRSRP